MQEGIAELPLARMTNPATGEPGAHVRFLDAPGPRSSRKTAGRPRWSGSAATPRSPGLEPLEFTTHYTPDATGEILLGFAGAGNGRIIVNGELLHEENVITEGTDLGAAFLSPPSSSVAVPVVEGEPIDVTIEYDIEQGGPLAGALSITIGIEPDRSNPEQLIADAVEAARSAEVALVVVGTNSRVESEGYDRESLALPGRQDELVRAVAAVNPRTVVVVNSGSPVLLPWRNEVAACC